MTVLSLQDAGGKFWNWPAEDRERRSDPSAAEDEALDALCSTVPTTIAGARAAIEHVMAVEDSAEGGLRDLQFDRSWGAQRP